MDARKEILNIIEKGKLPIVEGGSWFYLKHLFTGICDAYDRPDIYQEAKQLALRVINQDKRDFLISFSRYENLAS